jgi:hypothetical protein
MNTDINLFHLTFDLCLCFRGLIVWRNKSHKGNLLCLVLLIAFFLRSLSLTLTYDLDITHERIDLYSNKMLLGGHSYIIFSNVKPLLAVKYSDRMSRIKINYYLLCLIAKCQHGRPVKRRRTKEAYQLA